MDEVEYKSALEDINPQQCVFEKAIFTTRCHCPLSQRFCIADRQGISCQSTDAQQLCKEYLNLLREQSRFLFHQTHAPSVLPHAKEIKVQLGGLFALKEVVDDSQDTPDMVKDIRHIMTVAWMKFDSFKSLDLPQIINRIAHFEIRKSKQ